MSTHGLESAQPLDGHGRSHDAADPLMSHLLVGLSLALVGSVALNASYLIQHAGSVDAPTIAFRHPMRTFAALLRSRLWLVGGVVGITGWAISIAALTQAPLSLVQAFLIGGIALLAPVAVRVLGHHVTLRELAGIALVLFALFVLLVGRGAVGVHSQFHNAALGIYLTGSVCARRVPAPAQATAHADVGRGRGDPVRRRRCLDQGAY